MNFKLKRYELFISHIAGSITFIKEYIDIIKILIRPMEAQKNKNLIFFKLISISRFCRMYKIAFLSLSVNLETNSSIKKQKIDKLKRSIDLLKYPTAISEQFTKDNITLEFCGWVSAKYQFESLRESKYIINSFNRVKRKDVSLRLGKEYKFSGFRYFTKLVNFNYNNFRVQQKSNPTISFSLNPGNAMIFDILEFSDNLDNSKETNIGFIDDIKIILNFQYDLNYLDFCLFTNIFIRLNLDSAFRFVDHGAIVTIFEIIAKTNSKLLANHYINTAVAQKLKASLPPTIKIEFFEYGIQHDTLPRIVNLTNARLLAGKFIIDDKGILVNEFSDTLGSDLVSGVERNLFCDFDHSSITGCFTSPTKIVTLEKGIVLPSLVNSNWFHFITESLAPLVWFKDEIPRDIPIIFLDDIPKNVELCLEVFKFNNLIKISKNTEIKVDHLITFSKSTIVKDSVMSDINSFQINSELILHLRNEIFQILEVDYFTNSLPVSLFFVRDSLSRSFKWSKNQKMLMKKKGFELVSIGKYSFTDQVKICLMSDNVIIEGGAALINMMFMKPNCKILYLTNEKLVNYKLPEQFASIFGLNIKLAGGKVKLTNSWKARNYLEIFHSDYSFSTTIIKKFLYYFRGRFS